MWACMPLAVTGLVPLEPIELCRGCAVQRTGMLARGASQRRAIRRRQPPRNHNVTRYARGVPVMVAIAPRQPLNASARSIRFRITGLESR